jgi:predicted DNA-binding protein
MNENKEEVRITFRMPVELRDRVKASSKSNNRSMNAEIVDRLERSFEASNSTSQMDRIEAAVNSIIQKIGNK